MVVCFDTVSAACSTKDHVIVCSGRATTTRMAQQRQNVVSMSPEMTKNLV